MFLERPLDKTSEDLYLKEMTKPNPDFSLEQQALSVNLDPWS